MAHFFAQVFLPLTLALVMMGMGLSLTLNDFGHVLRQPRSLLLGLVCQLLLFPALAMGLAIVSPLSVGFKVGLVLMAACPGGISSGLVTHLFRGNVALSIALTACNSFFTLITIPLTLNAALAYFMGETQSVRLPISDTAFDIFILTILPAFVGIAIRRQYPNQAQRLERPLRYVMPLLLGAAFVGVMLSNDGGKTQSIAQMLRLVPYAFLLNALGIVGVFCIVRLLGFDRPTQITLPVEAGLHNTSLAIYISATLLQNNDMTMVGVTYGAITFATTLFWVSLIARYWASKVAA